MSTDTVFKYAGHGGDMLFQQSKGGASTDGYIPGDDGKIIFRSSGGTNILEINPAGDFIVRGRLAGSDQEIFKIFKSWLRDAEC